MVTKRFITLCFVQLIFTLTSYVVSEVDNLSEKDMNNDEPYLAKQLETALLKEDYEAALDVSKLINNDAVIETAVQNVYNSTDYDFDILLYLARDIAVGDAKRRAGILKTIYVGYKYKHIERGHEKKYNPKSHCEGLKLMYTIQNVEKNSPELSNELKKLLPNLDNDKIILMPTTYRNLLDVPSKTSKRIVPYLANHGFVVDDFVELKNTKEEILFAKYEVILNKTKQLHKTKCYVRITSAEFDLNVMNQISDEVQKNLQYNKTTDECVNALVQRLENDLSALEQYNSLNNVYIQKGVIYEFYKSTRDINRVFELSDHVPRSGDIYSVLYETIPETAQFEICELLKLIVRLESIADKQFKNSSNHQELLERAKTRLTNLQYDFIMTLIYKTEHKPITQTTYRIVNDVANSFSVYDADDSSPVFSLDYFIKYFDNNSKSTNCYTHLSIDEYSHFHFMWLQHLIQKSMGMKEHGKLN